MLIHIVEHYGIGKSVDELRLKGLLYLSQHRLATGNITAETYTCLGCILRSGIGSHHEDNVSEVCLLTLVIG